MLALAIVTLAALPAGTAGSSSSSESGPALGFWLGNWKPGEGGGRTTPQLLADISRWLGRDVFILQDKINNGDWSFVRGEHPWYKNEVLPGLSAWLGGDPRRRLIFSMDYMPHDGSLEAFARGDYDHHYRALARNLVRAGIRRAAFRVGYEFDGWWFAGNIHDDDKQRGLQKAKWFAAGWRRLVAAMRGAAPGAEWEFIWNPTNALYQDWQAAKRDAAWPGDAYVDIVGVDTYDSVYGLQDWADVRERWRRVEEELRAPVRFAKAHNKPIGVYEWGVWNNRAKEPERSGPDNPYYIEKMHGWLHDPANRVIEHVYFNTLDKHRIWPEDVTRNPKAAAKFRQLFGRDGSTPEPGGGDAMIPCHGFNAADPIAVGYGAAYDVLSSTRHLLLQAFCNGSGAIISVGDGLSGRYIYRHGYEWLGNRWQLIDFSGSEPAGDAWYAGQVKATLPRTAEELTRDNFFVAYACTWTGAQWKCGCRDSACTQAYWQLQQFRTASPGS